MSVQIPPQKVRGGVVVLQVLEGTVARLRITGSRYYSPEQVRKAAPSLAEGRVIDFNDVTRDIVALNQLPTGRFPSLRAGTEPGTADVDLTVKDKLPLHGSVELNNRYSPDTTELRLNGSVSYNNLWRLGHSIGFSFQISPENLEEVKVFSGYYLLRLPDVTWLSFLLQRNRPEQQRLHPRWRRCGGERPDHRGARAVQPAAGQQLLSLVQLWIRLQELAADRAARRRGASLADHLLPIHRRLQCDVDGKRRAHGVERRADFQFSRSWQQRVGI